MSWLSGKYNNHSYQNNNNNNNNNNHYREYAINLLQIILKLKLK